MTWAEAILRTTRALDRLRAGEVDLVEAELSGAGLAGVGLADFGPELGPLPPSLADEARRCLSDLLEFEAQLQARLDTGRAELAATTHRPATTTSRGPAFVDLRS